jgi:hypothetical protein
MRRSGFTLAVVALAAGSSGVGATRLDKSACNLLNAELAGIVATGTRDDMEQGPAWAKANLPPVRLGKIRRLIELEEQLEFRCGMGRNRIVAVEAKPPTGPAGKIKVPEEPEKKPTVKTNAPKQRQDATNSVPGASAAQKKPALQKAAATTTLPPAKPAAPPSTTESVASAAPQPQAPESPAKSSRRRSSAGYVSPAEVNPFFVTRYGDTQ